MASIKERIDTSTNNVKSGKTLVKNAINDKLSGGITAATPTFKELADSINSVSTGGSESLGYFLMKDGSTKYYADINSSNKANVIGFVLTIIDVTNVYSGKNIAIATGSLEASKALAWSPNNYLYGVDVPGLTNYEGSYGTTHPTAINDRNGKNNTKVLVDYCNSKSWATISAIPAAYFCINYDPGYGKGQWYLPSVGELSLLFNDNWSNYQYFMDKVGLNQYIIKSGSYGDTGEYRWYWSSTEVSSSSAWYWYSYNSYFYNYGKYNTGSNYRVIPFFAF